MGFATHTLSKNLAKGKEPAPQRPTRTNSWDRAVIFDPRKNSVDIRKKSEVAKTVQNGDFPCREITLPRKTKELSLFVGHDDETALRTENERKTDDVFLARLNLDHLGLSNRARLRLGYLKTLYVYNGIA
ncbi:hypothetical protein ACJQWK_03982 [Exserohilum turcicum]|uniref:Uncharacterized protein n=1 Tax=Exserohilum turcicum (strain 28A) TaxID=671987 RepID=R0KGC1_EXST2|nr:uncharacterized protein SETTUDRAFT_162472 [Exserohilum turcica Et28A]EOA91908.1 hypothetical protein SETTUDRAFT_162472 [Exserohilum turcica Et28A]